MSCICMVAFWVGKEGEKMLKSSVPLGSVRVFHANAYRIAVQLMSFQNLLQAGDLASTLWRPELCWEQRGHKIALGVARGLQFLHSCKIIHRCGTRTQYLPPQIYKGRISGEGGTSYVGIQTLRRWYFNGSWELRVYLISGNKILLVGALGVLLRSCIAP